MACNSDRKGRVFQGGFNSGTYTNNPLAVSKIAKGDIVALFLAKFS